MHSKSFTNVRQAFSDELCEIIQPSIIERSSPFRRIVRDSFDK